MLKRLMQRKDVSDLINACDAGREGELIFRYLVKLSGSKKPIRRLWLQSMTAESIRSAFEHLRIERRNAFRWRKPRFAVPRATGWSVSTARAP